MPVICTESAFDEALAIYFSTRGKLKERASERRRGARDEVPGAHRRLDIIEIVDSRADRRHRHEGLRHPPRAARGRAARSAAASTACCTSCASIPNELQAGIISRLKIMGNMDIAERRLPQDGRTSFETADGDVVDMRLASIPSLYGENITIRILEVSPLPPTLVSLGFAGDRAWPASRRPSRRRTAASSSSGRPAAASRPPCTPRSSSSSRRERKVYTVEDPIERKIDGIVQTEVKPVIGLTFAQALRSLVRADPDVIMVGEVRDLETAKMAADAAITGHLVFTTLHTGDAVSSINRLVEMGAAAPTWWPPPGAASSPSGSCAACAATAAAPR